MDSGVSSPPVRPAGAAIDRDTLIESLHALRGREGEPDYWQRLCEGLAQLCRARGVQVLQADGDGRWRLLGSHAEPGSALAQQNAAWLAALAPRALAAGRAFVPPSGDSLACAVRLRGPEADTLALLDIPARERGSLNELLLRAQLVADLPAAGAVPQAPERSAQPLVALMDLVAQVMQAPHHGAATLRLVNLLATRLGCDQVVLGSGQDGALAGQVQVVAISHIERFEHRAENVQMLAAALEEALDQHVDLVHPAQAEDGCVHLAHDALARAMGYAQLATLALHDERDGTSDGGPGQPPMALLMARRQGAWTAAELRDVSVALHLLRPWLANLRERARPWPERLWRQAVQRARGWSSPAHPARKIAALVALALVAVVVFGRWPYRIEATAELATDSMQVISAPFDGHLASVAANLGDSVAAGAVLAELDVRELRLQAAEQGSELRRQQAEADRARAAAQAAETRIAEARVQQIQARLQRIEFQLAQARLLAPAAAVVVDGERKQLLGVPTRQGEMLFRLARVEGLYGVLQVSERDLREMPQAARGELRLLGRPDHPLGFHVERVVPVVQPRPGVGGHVEVRVRLDEAPEPWWRPGMSGLAMIEAGERPILWIWTHRLIDRLRLWLWW